MSSNQMHLFFESPKVHGLIITQVTSL